MSTSKLAMKLRLAPETFAELHRLHPGYGEAQRVLRDLVEGYLSARRASADEIVALADAVLKRVKR